MSEVQEVEKSVMVAGKTIISLNEPTPKWATWVFRTEFIINKAVMLYLNGTASIPDKKKLEYILILTVIDFVVWGAGRFLGVRKDNIQQEIEG